MKSIDSGFEKKGIHEGDEGIYNNSSHGREEEFLSADDFKGSLDELDLFDEEELYGANDFGRASFGDKYFISKTDSLSAKEIDKAFEQRANEMMSKLDDLFK